MKPYIYIGLVYVQSIFPGHLLSFVDIVFPAVRLLALDIQIDSQCFWSFVRLKVLDMCAAPGSKTAQLIEFLHAADENGSPSGQSFSFIFRSWRVVYSLVISLLGYWLRGGSSTPCLGGNWVWDVCFTWTLHSFIQTISIVPLQVHYYSEAQLVTWL